MSLHKRKLKLIIRQDGKYKNSSPSREQKQDNMNGSTQKDSIIKNLNFGKHENINRACIIEKEKKSNSVDRKQYYIPISERLMMNKDKSLIFVGQAAYSDKNFKVVQNRNKYLNEILQRNWNKAHERQ